MITNQAGTVTAAQRPTPPPLQLAGEPAINCNDCHVTKPETEFAFKNKATGKRNTKCKACMREYAQANYKANKPARVAAANARNVVVRAETRAEVATLLADVRCTECAQLPTESNDLIVVLPGGADTAGQRLSKMIERGWAPSRIRTLVAESIESGSVLCRHCLGKRCGAQNQRSIAARARVAAVAAS